MTSDNAANETNATAETPDRLRGLQALKCRRPLGQCIDCYRIRSVDSNMNRDDLMALAYHCLHDIFDFHVGVAQGCSAGRSDCLALSESWNRFDEIVGALIANTSPIERDRLVTDFEKLISECQKDVDAIEAEYRRQHEETYGPLEKSTGMEGAICDSSDTSPVDEKFFESLRKTVADNSPSESLRKEEGPETLASDEDFFERLRERSQ